MASTPQVQTHRHVVSQVVARACPAWHRQASNTHRGSLAVVAANRDRSGRSPSPVAPGKTVNKTVSSKSSGSTASAKTRANASATNATTEPDERQDSNIARPESPRPNRETTRVPANPIAALAAQTDGALIFGDMWIAGTAFATSGLLCSSDIPAITTAALSVWCITSFVRGDYSTVPESESSWIHGWSTYTGILYACHTWLFATPVLLLAYALLVSNGLLDADPVMHVAEGARVSPALELQVALLILMTAWRGIYYAFKDGIL